MRWPIVQVGFVLLSVQADRGEGEAECPKLGSVPRLCAVPRTATHAKQRDQTDAACDKPCTYDAIQNRRAGSGGWQLRAGVA